MAAAAPLAAVSSLASIGFAVAGNSASQQGYALQGQAAQLKAQGQAAADTFQAEEAERAAAYGELKATQTSAVMTRQLATTLGNIEAVRAAANTSPFSPTGIAMRETSEDIGNTERAITVDNIMAQSRQNEADAAYLRRAASSALVSGDIGARAAGVAGEASTLNMFGKIAGGLPGMGKSAGIPGLG